MAQIWGLRGPNSSLRLHIWGSDSQDSQGGGTEGRKDGRKDGRTSQNSPLCPTGHWLFGATALKGRFQAWKGRFKAWKDRFPAWEGIFYARVGIFQAWEGLGVMNKWTNKQTKGWTDRRKNERKSPVLFRTSSPSGLLPKNQTTNLKPESNKLRLRLLIWGLRGLIWGKKGLIWCLRG